MWNTGIVTGLAFPGAITIIWGLEKAMEMVGIALAAVHGVIGVNKNVPPGVDLQKEEERKQLKCIPINTRNLFKLTYYLED